MNILGIGPLELFFILVLALIILGPKDMAKAGRSLAQTVSKLNKSQSWRALRQISHEINEIPHKIMSETKLEEIQKDLGKELGKLDKEIAETTPTLTLEEPGIAKDFLQKARSDQNKETPEEQKPN